MLRAGANVDANLEYYGTPLLFAAMNGTDDFVAMLLRCGASFSNFHLGSKLEYIDAQRIGGNSPPMTAVATRRPQVVRPFVKHGARINDAKGILGNALQTTIRLGYCDVLEALFEVNFESIR
jgi:ankyrin repeat protein